MKEMHRGSHQHIHWSPGCVQGGQIYIIDVMPRSQTSTVGSGPLQLGRAGSQSQPRQAQCHSVPMHSPALSPAAVSSCSEAPWGVQAVLHCGKCLLQLVPSSTIYMTTVTENPPIQVAVIFWISVPNNLEMWFGMLWELLETVRQQDAMGAEFDFAFLSLPKD